MTDTEVQAHPFDDIFPPIMVHFWMDRLMDAIKDPDTLAEFREDTNCDWQPPRSPIEHMVDDASGVGFQVAKDFAKWWTAKHWGVNPDGSTMDYGDFKDEPLPPPPSSPHRL